MRMMIPCCSVASDRTLYESYHAWRNDPLILADMEQVGTCQSGCACLTERRQIDHNVRGYSECMICKAIKERQLQEAARRMAQ